MNNVTIANNVSTYLFSALVNPCEQRTLPYMLPVTNNIPVGTRIKIKSGNAVQFDSFPVSFSLCLMSMKYDLPFVFECKQPFWSGNIQEIVLFVLLTKRS